ncbi:MAG TPA: replication-associated recombination protein A [bacterium]|nr:replication-associated recombination protein A [bacterium]HNT64382.1 replication-associated recombination protein A [bacterium]HOX85372.1 replication-associated recombination protein A [bacterium]HPG44531.1 replication-associated recombination protein A [bacterium]HPM97089.1 replication-associated recombination protein A [bacterium]
MSDLFDDNSNAAGERPLADRMRPQTLAEFIGQKHVLGPDKVLRRAIETDQLVSMILWGPPGVGKTTLARLIANATRSQFFSLSAVSSGVGEVRKVIARAEELRRTANQRTLLFIDEIHRFNKSQQDALLHSVEDGTLLLIGATTENPSFEVISALLSRCRIYKLEPLASSELEQILDRALEQDSVFSVKKLAFADQAKELLITLSSGDARTLLNALELAGNLVEPNDSGIYLIDRTLVEQAMQRRAYLYDKKGEYHYDTISAFIKSVRGSDPDAAIYWLATMLEGGEDPKFIARRLMILASEDIGNADPHALMLATSTFDAVHTVGMPEARIILAQATTYLASAPKSNASYLAIAEAEKDVQNNPAGDVPLHLRNAPTAYMKQIGFASGYKYPHSFGGFVDQDYFPPEARHRVYYRPTENGIEQKIKQRLQNLWPHRKRS